MTWFLFQSLTKRFNTPEYKEHNNPSDHVRPLNESELAMWPGTEKTCMLVDLIVIIGGGAVFVMGLAGAFTMPHWAIILGGSVSGSVFLLDFIGLCVTRAKLINRNNNQAQHLKNEIEDLGGKKEKLIEENKKNEIEDLDGDKEKLIEENNKLKNLLKIKENALNEEIEDKKKNETDLSQLKNVSNIKFRKLEFEKNLLEGENNNLFKEKFELNNKIQTLQDELNKAEKEINKLKTEKNEIIPSTENTEYSRLLKEKEELKQKITELTKEIEKLTKELEKSKEEYGRKINELTNDCKEHKERSDNLVNLHNKKISEQNKAIFQQEALIQEYSKENKELTNLLELLQQQKTTTIDHNPIVNQSQSLAFGQTINDPPPQEVQYSEEFKAFLNMKDDEKEYLSKLDRNALIALFTQTHLNEQEKFLENHHLKKDYEILLKIYRQLENNKESSQVDIINIFYFEKNDEFHGVENKLLHLDNLLSELIEAEEEKNKIQSQNNEKPQNSHSNNSTNSPTTNISVINQGINDLHKMKMEISDFQDYIKSRVEDVENSFQKTKFFETNKKKQLVQKKQSIIEKSENDIRSTEKKLKLRCQQFLHSSWSKDEPRTFIDFEIKGADTTLRGIVNSIPINEQNYIKKMNVFISFLDCLNKESSEIQITDLRKAINKLIELHKSLLTTLDNEGKMTLYSLLDAFDPEKSRNIIEAVLQFEKEYCKIREKIESMKKSKECKQIIENAIKEFKKINSVDLNSIGCGQSAGFTAILDNFLIAPRQHVLRYQTVWGEIEKQIEKNDVVHRRTRGLQFASTIYNQLTELVI